MPYKWDIIHTLGDTYVIWGIMERTQKATNTKCTIIIYGMHSLYNMLCNTALLDDFIIIEADTYSALQKHLVRPLSIILYEVIDEHDWEMINSLLNFSDQRLNIRVITLGVDKKCTIQKPVKIRRLLSMLIVYTQNKYYIGDHIIFDYTKRSVIDTRCCICKKLSEKEADMLKYLVINNRVQFTQNRIMYINVQKCNILQDVWGYNNAVNTKTFESHMHRLRVKLNTLGIEMK